MIGLEDMFAQDFMRNAFGAGTAIALAAGPIGYFLILRSQVFAADALGHVAFTGSVAALALGLNPLIGLLVATVLTGALLNRMSGDRRANDVMIGSLFAWILGLGVLFLAIYATFGSAGNGSAGIVILFGSIFGLQPNQTFAAVGVSLAVLVIVLAVFRPLLFVTLDPEVAAARGLPIRRLGLILTLLSALTVAQASQAVGALLILALVATPGAIALRLCSSPGATVATTTAIAVGGMWAGLTLSYAVPRIPPSFAIVCLLFGTFVIVTAATAIAGRLNRGAPVVQPE